MRVLITNNTLATRAGTELYVRDVAFALKRRGHVPAAYSAILGEVAKEIRGLGVTVLHDLDELEWKPDLIHGQHHLETMTALMRFPGVPAVYFYHGFMPWQETPVLHPRIMRYVAVDDACRDSARNDHGIDEDRIVVIHNFVDMNRFKRRPSLPPRPKRALVFSNYASEETHLPAVREACNRSGIELEVAGAGSGTSKNRPEDLLKRYDLVFAKGRAALEAMAVGAAVIICDSWGLGPMVTTQNVGELRRLNFGVKTRYGEALPAAVIAEIGIYDPDEAAAVTDVIRSSSGLEEAMDSIVHVYREAVNHFESQGAVPETEARANARYVRWVAALLKERDGKLNALQREFRLVKDEAGVRAMIRGAAKEALAVFDGYPKLQQFLVRTFRRARTWRAEIGRWFHT